MSIIQGSVFGWVVHNLELKKGEMTMSNADAVANAGLVGREFDPPRGLDKLREALTEEDLLSLFTPGEGMSKEALLALASERFPDKMGDDEGDSAEQQVGDFLDFASIGGGLVKNGETYFLPLTLPVDTLPIATQEGAVPNVQIEGSPVEKNSPPPAPAKKKDDRKAREHHLLRIRKAEANMYFPPSWRHKPPGATKDRDDEALIEEMTLEALKQTAWEAERIVRGCLEVAKGLLDKQHEDHVLETARLRVELVEAQGATALSGAHEPSVATQEIDRLTRDLELEKKRGKDNESALAGFKSESERKSQQIMVMQEEIEELMKRLESSAATIADLEARVSPTPPVLLPPALPPVPEKTPEAAPKADEGAEVPPIIRAELPVAASQKNNDWIGWILVSAVAIACAVGGWLM